MMANAMTSCRIVLAVLLIFMPVGKPLFWVCYLFGGLSDVLDGFLARRHNEMSRGGAIFDTVADFVFFLACLWRFLPYLALPVWLWIWIAGIAVIKGINLALGFVLQKRFVSVHLPMNRITGVLLFLLPATAVFSVLPYGVGAVCAVATFAAIEEGIWIKCGRSV